MSGIPHVVYHRPKYESYSRVKSTFTFRAISFTSAQLSASIFHFLAHDNIELLNALVYRPNHFFHCYLKTVLICFLKYNVYSFVSLICMKIIVRLPDDSIRACHTAHFNNSHKRNITNYVRRSQAHVSSSNVHCFCLPFLSFHYIL